MTHTIPKIKQTRTQCGSKGVKVTDERKTYLKEPKFTYFNWIDYMFSPNIYSYLYSMNCLALIS